MPLSAHGPRDEFRNFKLSLASELAGLLQWEFLDHLILGTALWTSVNYGFQATPGPLPVLINKVALESATPVPFLIVCGCFHTKTMFNDPNRDHTNYKAENISYLARYRRILLPGVLEERSWAL